MRSTLLLTAMFVCIALSTSVSAKEDPEWLDKTRNAPRLLQAKDCADLWNVLWPEAKAGDLEARAILFYFMIPPPDLTFLYAPGNSGDLVSRQRDITTMAVHSQAYDGPFEPGYRDLVYERFVSAGFAISLKGDQFLECVKTSGDNCADIAVKAKLVPSFEDFAKQIDAMTAAGMKSTCK